MIDTGINLNHPDLNVDAARSRNFSNGNSPEDGNGHGSHVAGIIGAKDNSIGVVGVSPGATLVAVRVLNNAGSGTNSDVIAGVNYVAANGHERRRRQHEPRRGVSQALDQAVVNAAATGVKFTLAAGNEVGFGDEPLAGAGERPQCLHRVGFRQGGERYRYRRPVGILFELRQSARRLCRTRVGHPLDLQERRLCDAVRTSMAAPHLAGILLAGAVHNGGTVDNDPDGNPDTIGTK